MLTAYLDLVQRAYREHWALGAFNASNLETVQAIIQAAEELRSPVVVQTSEKSIDYAGLHEIALIVKSLASHARVPVVLNLDRGSSYDIAEQCVAEGYTALSRDASDFSFEKNCLETHRVVRLGHAHRLGVEGTLRVTEDAHAFVEKTEVDVLAFAAGDVQTEGEGARIDLVYLQKIARAIQGVPLALYDVSCLSQKDVVASIRSGVVKITVDTEIRYAFTENLRANLSQQKTLYDPRGILGPAKDAVKAKVKEKIILFGSSGKV